MKAFIAPVVASLAVAGAANASFSYQIDDGTSENAVGLTGGGIISWGNMFSVDATGTIVNDIEIGFGPGVAGTDMTWRVFIDDDGDPTAGLIEIGSGLHTIVNDDYTLNGIVDLIGVGGLDVSGGPFLFVTAESEHVAGTFPAALDQGASDMSSWVSIGTSGAGDWGAQTTDLIDAFGLPGNWIIRANAIPAPGAIALLGLAGLGGTRRRRG